MTGPNHDYVELFGELHKPARLGPSLRSGFRRAALTPRNRLNLASGVTCAHHDYVELFGELGHR